MSAKSKHVTRERGDTYRLRFTFTDPDTGTALDLTGGTLVMTVATEEFPEDDTTEVFSVAGSIVGAETSGVVDFEPTVADAANVGKMYYDVQLTDSSGKVRTLCRGKYLVVQDITK